MCTIYTLVFIKNNTKILLGYKKCGDLGVNKWHGFGGKVEEGETIVQAAVRELHEESGLKLQQGDLRYLGYNVFEEPGYSARKVHMFAADTIEAEPEETVEMKPKWFDFSSLPFDEMWPDSRYWLHMVINEVFFVGTFTYDCKHNVQRAEIKVLDTAPSFQ